MPHQCTTCGQVFDDGSKEMLGGCPECGNNTFQFHAGDPPEEPTDDAPTGGPSSRVGRAAETVREFVTGDPDWDDWPGERDAPPEDGPPSGGDSDIIEAPVNDGDGPEDRAQADARTAVVDPDTVPDDAESSPAAAETGPPDPDGSRPDPDPDSDPATDAPETDLAALRDELDDQFESIRIVEPGQYELNLMELYNREEYIVALQEDGRYVIEVPGSWRDDAVAPDDGN